MSRSRTRTEPHSYIDPYAFGPVLGPLDDYLLVEGTHRQLYRRLGAQLISHEGVDGVLFAVWAPNARARFRGRRLQQLGRPAHARCASASTAACGRSSSPDSATARSTSSSFRGPDGALLPLKADPFGFEAELRPATASVVADTDDFAWTDAEYMAKRGEGEPRRKPMSIYEVHLGSWRRGDGRRFLTYDELADS